MISAVGLFILLAAFVSDAAASCRKVINDDMLEYSCEGGYPTDLVTIPETTEKLKITKMPFRRITADTFSRFGRNLWVLSCSYCEISDIDANAFRRLVNLQQLSLNNNYLSTVKASWFEGLIYLTYLDLNYNEIRDIEEGVYTNLPSLVDFRISGNRLRCLNLNEMSQLRELKRMFLSENPDFVCPHAVSKFMENQGVSFKPDSEWRKISSDAIDVYMPPNYEENDRDKSSVPEHRENLHPERRPPKQPAETPYMPAAPAGDRMFRPDYHSDPHYEYHQRPRTTTTPKPIPRVELIPTSQDTKIQTLPESSSRQTFHPYPTLETTSVESRFSEDSRLTAEVERPLLIEDKFVYPSYTPTYEMTAYSSHITSEESRIYFAGSELSSSDTETADDLSPPIEHTSPYPSYVPTRESFYSTSERPRTPIMGSRPHTESIRAGVGQPPLSEDILTYPSYDPSQEVFYSHTTTERPQIPNMKSEEFSENVRAELDQLSLREDTFIHPIPTLQTISYPWYTTSERSRISATESKTSSRDEMTVGSDGLQAKNTITYPLYYPSSDSREEIAEGSMQVTRLFSSDADSINTSTISSMEHSDNSSGTQDEEHQPDEEARATQKKPHATHNSSGVAVDGWSSSSINDSSIATDHAIEDDNTADPSRETTMSSDDFKDTHYVRPLPASYPELMHSPAADEFYQAPYYESTVTLHPPLQNHQDSDDQATSVIPLEITTTDKPLPECPKKNSASRIRPASVLVMSIVITIFGHVIVEGF